MPLGQGDHTYDYHADWAGFPNDPKYQYQWHMGQINMPDAWKLADGAHPYFVPVEHTAIAREAASG